MEGVPPWCVRYKPRAGCLHELPVRALEGSKEPHPKFNDGHASAIAVSECIMLKDPRGWGGDLEYTWFLSRCVLPSLRSPKVPSMPVYPLACSTAIRLTCFHVRFFVLALLCFPSHAFYRRGLRWPGLARLTRPRLVSHRLVMPCLKYS